MKQILFFISLFAVVIGLTYCQYEQGHNVKSESADSANEKARLLIEKYYTTYSTDSAIAYSAIDELRLLSPMIYDSLTKSMIYRCESDFFEKKDLIKKAIGFYEKGLNALDGLQSREADIERAKILVNKGNIFQKFGEIDTALSFYLEAERLFLMYDYFDPLIAVYSAMGDIFIRNGDVERNAAIIDKSTSIIKHIDDPEKLANYYINMANVYGSLDRMDSAYLFFEKAENILEKSQNHHQLGTLYYNLGFYLNHEDKPGLAEDSYRKSLAEYQKVGVAFDICDAKLRIGGSLYYQKKYAEAEAMLLDALEMAKKQNSLLLIRNTYDVLSYLEYDRGNFEQAFEYLDKYIDVQSELTSEKVQNRMNFLTVKYETEKKELKISDLEEKTGLQYILLIITGVLLILLIGLIFLSRRNMKQKALIAKQHIVQLEQEKKLAGKQAVLDGEVAERRRIARDLHDGLGSMLAVVKLNLKGVKSYAILEEEDVQHFNRAIETLNDSIGELSRVARNMMPESLVRYGLKASLTDFCGSTDLVRFHFFGNEKRIDSKLELLIYRSIHELVHNALKHAEASQINVQLLQESNRVSVTVQDDGKGFDIAAQSKGMGIGNIKKRVAVYNGQMDILSSQGEGTEVNIEFHL